MPSSAPRKPSHQAPRVDSAGSQIIFIRLALSAVPPLSRSEASDSVAPIQISASGRLIWAK